MPAWLSGVYASTYLFLVAGALFIVLAVILIFVMPERGFHPTAKKERNPWKQMGDTLVNGGRLVRQRPILLTLLSIALFYGMFSKGFDRLWTAHFCNLP